MSSLNLSFQYEPLLADDEALSRLPDEIQTSIERLIVTVIYESYVTSADEDYLSARVLGVKGLPRSFAWGAGQAVEKYLKAYLLFKGRKVNGKEFQGHPIRKLYNAAVSVDPNIANISLAPHPDINAELHLQAHIRTISLPDFIDILERNGSPANRYNSNGIDFDTNYIFALDSFIYGFRSIIGVPAIEASFERFDEDIMRVFMDNNPYFFSTKEHHHSKIATHSFRLLRGQKCTAQEYLLKNERAGVNMHALSWLRERMKI